VDGVDELARGFGAFLDGVLLGALTRGAMLIAISPDPVATRHAVANAMRALLNSFIPQR
jgi:hypothetical protein